MTWTLDSGILTLDSVLITLDGSGGIVGMPDTGIFIWSPTYGFDQDSSLKLREARFGDGYIQRSGVGINNIDDGWNLIFGNRSKDERDAIVSFLRARSSGQSFRWVPPGEADEIMVICKKWKASAPTYRAYTVTCLFEQVYGE